MYKGLLKTSLQIDFIQISIKNVTTCFMIITEPHIL